MCTQLNIKVWYVVSLKVNDERSEKVTCSYGNVSTVTVFVTFSIFRCRVCYYQVDLEQTNVNLFV